VSKSLKRVIAALSVAGVKTNVLEMGRETRTAQQAADAIDCAVDQIAKSIIFQAIDSGNVVLLLTAGGNQVDAEKASGLVGETLGRADADLVRARTGFAIGGVAPIGHLNPLLCFMDARLFDFELIYAAAGTPRHIFSIAPNTLRMISGATIAEFVI